MNPVAHEPSALDARTALYFDFERHGQWRPLIGITLVARMNAVGVIGMVVMFSGLIFDVVAGVLYEPPIQRYLERLGKKPVHLLVIGGIRAI